MIDGVGARFATVRGMNLKTRSSGINFQSSLEEVRKKRAMDSYVQGASIPTVPCGLNGQEIQELAEKYDPECMTQEEYQSFVDDLVQKGVFTEWDKNFMGCEESVCVGRGDEDWSSGATHTGPLGTKTLHDLSDANGNVLQWARQTSTWVVLGNEDQKKHSFDYYKVPLFKKMTPILDAIAAARRG